MNKQSVSSSSVKSSDLGSIKESVQTLVDHGGEAVDEIKARVTEVSGEAKEKASAAYAEAEKFIKANPGKAILAAFGIGYLAMRIRTNPLFPVALIGGIGYMIKKRFSA